MSDIVERLSLPLPSGMCGESMGCNAASICLCSEIEDGRETMREAADEIQSLRQRVERLEGALRGIVDHFDKCDDGNAPGHAHSIPGIWDSDNHPAIAGKTCEWCAHWAEARAALSPKVQEGE